MPVKRRRVVADDVHRCHHPRCSTPVPEAMLACGDHWRQLPKVLRDGIWAAYEPGQEITKTPSRVYLAVAMKCDEWWRAHA